MGGLITPNTFVLTDAPLIFLAGPILGAPKWGDEAAIYIMSKHPEFFIASPTKERSKNLEKYVLNGQRDYFPRQRAWERHYLNEAALKGSIMFWLPEEIDHKCKKSYGAMTRVELGQIMTLSKYDSSLLWCIGSDGKFSELDIIAYDLSLDAPDKKILSTLEKTCDEAIRLAISR